MGEAYFFIWNKDKISERPLFDFGVGHSSTVTDPPYEIPLQPSEWKFFGVPYDFSIPLEQIYTENGQYIGDVGSLYAWRDGWKELNKGEELMPWQGFIYKSFSADRIIVSQSMKTLPSFLNRLLIPLQFCSLEIRFL